MVIVQATEGLLSSDLHTILRLPLIIKDQVNSQKDVGNLQWTLLVPQNKRKLSGVMFPGTTVVIFQMSTPM